MARTSDIQKFMRANRDGFETATALGEYALASFPDFKDEETVWELAAQIFYEER